VLASSLVPLLVSSGVHSPVSGTHVASRRRPCSLSEVPSGARQPLPCGKRSLLCCSGPLCFVWKDSNRLLSSVCSCLMLSPLLARFPASLIHVKSSRPILAGLPYITRKNQFSCPFVYVMFCYIACLFLLLFFFAVVSVAYATAL
jgi:hypothetical protein